MPNRNIGANTTFDGFKNTKIEEARNKEIWEIKLAWSEYRNGKWTQKQVSTDSVISTNDAATVPDIRKYQFVPTDVGDKILIDVIRNTDSATSIGSSLFLGAKLRAVISLPPGDNTPFTTDFHYKKE